MQVTPGLQIHINNQSMKTLKNLILLLVLCFLFACQKSAENENNTVTEATQPPAPPLNLSGEFVSISSIKITWLDNSDNETGFRVERKTEGGTYSVLSTLQKNTDSYLDINLAPNTVYTYRVAAYNNIGQVYSSSRSEVTVSTSPVDCSIDIRYDNISSSQVMSSQFFLNAKGGAITSCGIVWSKSPNVTISSTTKLVKSSVFKKAVISGLESGTTYYFRSFAVNPLGVSYSKEIVIETESIPCVLITDSSENSVGYVWMIKNLDVSRFRNGDAIPNVTDVNQWNALFGSGWRYYDNNPVLGQTYGKLYKWGTLDDTRGLAPQGWKIPELNDWDNTIALLGGYNVAGGKMKSTNNLWSSPNVGATNSSGFSVLPGGVYASGQGNLGISTRFGSRTINFTEYYVEFNNSSAAVIKDFGASYFGVYVRCLKTPSK